MRVFVTGGAGYIGTSLVEALNECNQVTSIVVYDNLSRNNYNFFFTDKLLNKLEFIEGDILDTIKLAKSLKNVDIVYHLAGFVSFPYNHGQNLQYEQVNRWGTLGLVNLVKANSQIKKFIYLSSSAVYGFGKSIIPDSLPVPANAYGASKYEAEAYVHLLGHTCEFQIVRSSNVYGYNRMIRLDGVINAFIFNALVKNSIKIYGNGEQMRSFVSIQKLTDHLLHIALNPVKVQVQLCSEFNASMNDLKEWLVEKFPRLSFTYLNQNQEFSGQAFEMNGSFEESTKKLAQVVEDFKSNICLITT